MVNRTGGSRSDLAALPIPACRGAPAAVRSWTGRTGLTSRARRARRLRHHPSAVPAPGRSPRPKPAIMMALKILVAGMCCSPCARFLPFATVGNARIVRRDHRDLCAGQLARNGTHLLPDVIATIARCKCLQLLFEIGALLAAQAWRARREAERPMTRRAGRHASQRIADFDQIAARPCRRDQSCPEPRQRDPAATQSAPQDRVCPAPTTGKRIRPSRPGCACRSCNPRAACRSHPRSDRPGSGTPRRC